MAEQGVWQVRFDGHFKSSLGIIFQMIPLAMPLLLAQASFMRLERLLGVLGQVIDRSLQSFSVPLTSIQNLKPGYRS